MIRQTIDMGHFFYQLVCSTVLLGRNVYGITHHPYATYRKLSQAPIDFRPSIIMGFLCILYFTFASLIRTGKHNPFLLTVQFTSLVTAAGVGFVLSVFLLQFLGRIVRSDVSWKRIAILWSYTLLPTLIWFSATSVLFILLPPPRTLSVSGKAYSVVYIAFSIAILFWKLILYYLTVRFSFRTGLLRIGMVSLAYIPAMSLFSYAMYRLGVFRIPFL